MVIHHYITSLLKGMCCAECKNGLSGYTNHYCIQLHVDSIRSQPLSASNSEMNDEKIKSGSLEDR